MSTTPRRPLFPAFSARRAASRWKATASGRRPFCASQMARFPNALESTSGSTASACAMVTAVSVVRPASGDPEKDSRAPSWMSARTVSASGSGRNISSAAVYSGSRLAAFGRGWPPRSRVRRRRGRRRGPGRRRCAGRGRSRRSGAGRICGQRGRPLGGAFPQPARPCRSRRPGVGGELGGGGEVLGGAAAARRCGPARSAARSSASTARPRMRPVSGSSGTAAQRVEVVAGDDVGDLVACRTSPRGGRRRPGGGPCGRGATACRRRPGASMSLREPVGAALRGQRVGGDLQHAAADQLAQRRPAPRAGRVPETATSASAGKRACRARPRRPPAPAARGSRASRRAASRPCRLSGTSARRRRRPAGTRPSTGTTMSRSISERMVSIANSGLPCAWPVIAATACAGMPGTSALDQRVHRPRRRADPGSAAVRLRPTPQPGCARRARCGRTPARRSARRGPSRPGGPGSRATPASAWWASSTSSTTGPCSASRSKNSRHPANNSSRLSVASAAGDVGPGRERTPSSRASREADVAPARRRRARTRAAGRRACPRPRRRGSSSAMPKRCRTISATAQ